MARIGSPELGFGRNSVSPALSETAEPNFGVTWCRWHRYLSISEPSAEDSDPCFYDLPGLRLRFPDPQLKFGRTKRSWRSPVSAPPAARQTTSEGLAPQTHPSRSWHLGLLPRGPSGLLSGEPSSPLPGFQRDAPLECSAHGAPGLPAPTRLEQQAESRHSRPHSVRNGVSLNRFGRIGMPRRNDTLCIVRSGLGSPCTRSDEIRSRRHGQVSPRLGTPSLLGREKIVFPRHVQDYEHMLPNGAS